MSHKHSVFKDRVPVHVFAGDGGRGCSSFLREKFIPFGGPDGGDGGLGGSVILEASRDVDSLVALYYVPNQRADHGGHGKGAKCTGENGKDLIIKVPCGTEVRELRSGDFIGEVLEHGQQLVVAKGGKGGRGNVHFKTATHQAPTEITENELGEKKDLLCELKTIADVGLVGYPNAGKSTLLAAVSNAHPKIAAYPFTTLNPLIGTIEYEDYTKIRVADIPGLIDGANEGIGLGHDFLRHIERASYLLFVIDMAGTDGRKPQDDFKNLRKELKLYRAELEHRPYLVIANKMDVEGAKKNLAAFKRSTKTKPVQIAAATGQGVPELKQMLYEWKRGLRFIDQPDAPLP